MWIQQKQNVTVTLLINSEVHVLHYVMLEATHTRQTCLSSSFCKPAKRAETIKYYQKQVLVVIKHSLDNSQISLILE